MKALLLNKIWTTSAVCKHVATGYSSTDVVQESLFLQKKTAYCKTRSSGIPHGIPDALFLDENNFIAVIMHFTAHSDIDDRKIYEI